MNKIIVKPKYTGWRLDKFLTEQMEDTRSQIQKQIKKELILVNKKPARVHEFLKAGDVISFVEIVEEEPTIAEKIKKVFQPKFEPKIIKKTKDYIVVEKPARMLVHATAKKETNTLVDWLIKKFPEVKKVSDPEALIRNEDIYRPGIVHRLDKDVSGLMVIARTQKGFDHLKSEFKLKKINKRYIALVHGAIEQDWDEITFPITRGSSGKFVACPQNSTKGKHATTEFEVKKRFVNYSLVELKLITGRTNQIRIHLSAYNHPIVGDDLYMPGKLKLKVKIKLARIFLHAAILEFTDLKEKDKNSTLNFPKYCKKPWGK